MNRVLELNAVEGTLHCEAGLITTQLQEYAAEQGLFYPVDFASAGSSQVGGNIATNAGGIKVIRYGMTRDWEIGRASCRERAEHSEVADRVNQNRQVGQKFDKHGAS